ncbi:MAG: hypothetical protein Q9228_006656 [Teloschistes exilis]
MASSTSHQRQDVADGILRPRPLKPGNPGVLRALGENGSHRSALGKLDLPNSGMSSGRSTPLPPDAPPSAVSISSARKQKRAQQKHRLFPTIDYAARLSHFDPKSEYRDFRGFFVLFWIGLAIMVITTMLRNIKDTGFPFRVGVWALLTERVWQLALTDAVMIASTALSLPLHRMFRNSRGWLWWEQGGMAVQSVYQALWLILWINWPFMLGWTWTAQVFFTLHTITMLMKMHSYAFYNGHLSTTEHRLSALDHPENVSTAAAVRYPRSSTDLDEINVEKEKKENKDNEDALQELREDLALELTSPLGQVTYPQNLTLYNYADYILCPTLCYELEYPRTERTQYLELFWKTLAVFGCIFLLTITSEEFIVPVLHDASLRLNTIHSTSETLLILSESISLLLFPFMVTFLLVFLVIFEYVLGAFAEITCFADRHFYSDWWNSCDWLEFSREWNIPVHHFLRRHVYGASRPYMSRNMSTLITFLLSALGHELVMGCITKKLRGYGFLAQMLQLPIVALQRTKARLGKSIKGNKAREAGNQQERPRPRFSIPDERADKVAPSFLHDLHALSAPYLQSLYNLLPASLQDSVDTFSSHFYPPQPHQSTAVISNYSTTEVGVAILLPLLFLLFSMASWRWWPSGGRSSPFAAGPGYGPPVVTDEDYSYVGPGDIDAPTENRNDSYGFPSSAPHRITRTDSDTPDILVLKHRGTTYPLHFPAYAIADGAVTVGEMRRLAARETKTEDHHRIKLLYKGRLLRDDSCPCRDEGLKQNSEIMCIVSETPSHPSHQQSSSSASEDEMIENGIAGPRVSVDGTIIDDRPQRSRRKGHRGGKSKKKPSSSNLTTPETPYATYPDRGHSPARTQSPPRPAPSQAPPQQQQPQVPPVKSVKLGPRETLDALASRFHTEFVPQCVSFINNPPADQKTKDFDYKKLSETILAQIILKLDAVETEGDEGLRMKRRELVKETQAMLNSLDRVGKTGGGK